MTNVTPFPWSTDESSPSMLVAGSKTVAIFVHAEDAIKVEEMLDECRAMRALLHKVALANPSIYEIQKYAAKLKIRRTP